MKVYSWNMLFRNRELDRAFEFIAHADFDIFCLQEVPKAFLKRLQTLPYFIAFRTDMERLSEEGYTRYYVVTLSKHRITSQGEIPFPDYWPLLPLRTRLFVCLMPSRLFTKIRNRGGLSVDVSPSAGTSFRVFNLHLILAHPTWRLKEFEQAMTEKDGARPTIVCGDFNILEQPHITILNWILGGRMTDALLYRRERTLIEERFVAHELANALRGESTHALSRSQLDHILVSRSFSIKSATVLPDRLGSDHHPIRVEVE
jgi:endonuclease/exonuclease/phosphatase family metal-dependent hydrolase